MNDTELSKEELKELQFFGKRFLDIVIYSEGNIDESSFIVLTDSDNDMVEKSNLFTKDSEASIEYSFSERGKKICKVIREYILIINREE